MAKFLVKFDGMGFTRRKALLDLGMTKRQLETLNQKLRQEGAFPANVLAVSSVGTSADGKEAGEWKVFTPVELLVEAEDAQDAENMEAPEELLLAALTALIKEDADMELGVRNSFEVLDVQDVEETEAASA